MSRGRLCRGLRRRLPVVRDQAGIERGGRLTSSWCWWCFARALHERLQRFPPRSTYRVMHPDLKGYWQFGRIDGGGGSSTRRCRPTPPRTISDFHGLIQKVAD
jgi:hypothetical protein